jgi:hypothetical protein
MYLPDCITHLKRLLPKLEGDVKTTIEGVLRDLEYDFKKRSDGNKVLAQRVLFREMYLIDWIKKLRANPSDLHTQSEADHVVEVAEKNLGQLEAWTLLQSEEVQAFVKNLR